MSKFKYFLLVLLSITSMLAFGVDKKITAPNGNLILDAATGSTVKSNKMLQANSGVGIGVSQSASKLHVVSGSGTTFADGILLAPNNDSTQGLSLWYDGAGSTVSYIDSRYSNNAALMKFRMKVNSTPVEAININGVGKVDFPNGIGIAGGSSTLSNYTVNTWTPVISCNSGSFTGQSGEGYYVRMGNGVFIFGKVFWSGNDGSLSGNTYITMPFDPYGSTSYSYPLQIFSTAGYGSQISLMSTSGTDQFYIYTTALAAVACTSFNTSGTIIFSGWIGL